MGKFFSFLLSLSIIALVGCAAVAGVSARFGGLSASPHSGVSVTGGVSTPPASNPSPQWNIANATANGKTFDLSTQAGAETPYFLAFNSDGTKFYTTIYTDADNAAEIYQYSMSTPWDVSTASFDNKTFNPVTQEDWMQGFYFSSDGLKLYLIGVDASPISVFEYTLSVAWDISTASYSGKSLDVTGQTTAGNGVQLKTDGAKMYVGSQNAPFGVVYQYTLGTPYDVSTGSYANKSFDFATDSGSAVQDFVFQTDGGRIFYATSGNNLIWQYDLGTAWDISTAQNKVSKAVFGGGSSTNGLAFKPDGTLMYVINASDKKIYEFGL